MMTLRNTLLAFVCLCFLSACNSDRDIIINYDADNSSSPDIIAGEHEAAARFIPAVTSNQEGKSIIKVDYYIQDLPDGASVKIYGQGNAQTPGDLLYSADVSSAVRADSWNSHTLSTPVPIGSEDIWVAIGLVHLSTIASIGCDAGPADSNGDFLWGTIDNEWITFRDRTQNATDINWNIRAIVSEE